MRKYFWSGALAALVLAAGIYCAASYARRHPMSFMARVAMVAYQVGFEANSPARVGEAVTKRVASCHVTPAEERAVAPSCTPVEPDPLPDEIAAQQLPALPPLEPIRVMPGHTRSTDIRPGPLSPTARNPFPEIVPVAADEADECPSVMPYCHDEETCSPPMTPHLEPSRSKFFDIFNDNKKSTDAVNKRLESLLREYQSPETHPVQRKVDTMEFRPSDARKGEFDRIPF